MFHCSVIKVPVVLSTAILDYHIFLSLSRTFFIFLKLFSELFPLVSVVCDSQSRLSHLSRSVKHFFEVFSNLFYSKRKVFSVFSTAYLIYHIFSFLSTTFYSFQNYSFIYLIANLNSTLIWNLNLQILFPRNSGIGFFSTHLSFISSFMTSHPYFLLFIILENLSFQHSASNRQIFIYILPPLLALFILKLLSEQLKNFLHYRNNNKNS